MADNLKLDLIEKFVKESLQSQLDIEKAYKEEGTDTAEFDRVVVQLRHILDKIKWVKEKSDEFIEGYVDGAAKVVEGGTE